MNSDLKKKIEALETAMETIQETLYQLKEQQRKMEEEEVQQVIELRNQKQEVNVAMQHVQQEESIVSQETMEEPKIEQVDRPIFKPEPFNIIKFCQTWLPRIFVAIMLLGVIWLFKAGVDAGLLTPAIRIVFGIALSVGLYYIGDLQIKQARQALGLVLAGGSITAIVLTTFAAHYLYDFFPASIAFLLNIIWIILGIYLAKRYQSEYLAIFVAIGAFFVPFLLNSTTPNSYIFFGYETILTISLLWYAYKNRYQYLYMISYGVSVLVTFLFFVIMSIQLGHLQVQLTTVYGCIHIVLFWHMFMNQHFIYQQRMAMFSTNALFFMMAIAKIPDFTTGGLLSSACVHFIMLAMEYKKNKKSLFTDVLFGFAMGSFSLAILYNYSLVNAAIVLMLQGFLGIMSSVKWKQELKLYISAVIYAIGMIQTMVSPFETFMSAAFIAHLLLIGTFYYGMQQVKQTLQHFGKYVYSIALYSFMILTFITITRIGEAISTNGSVINVSVSLLWMIYALASVWFGRSRRMNEILYTGLAVLVVTVGKLFFLDLPEVSMMIRAILFLLIGGIGIIISRMFFSKEK